MRDVESRPGAGSGGGGSGLRPRVLLLVLGIAASVAMAASVEALVRSAQRGAAVAEQRARALRLMNRAERSLARVWEAARLTAMAMETPGERSERFRRVARHLLVGEPGLGAVGWSSARDPLSVREGAAGAGAVLYRASIEPPPEPLWFVPAGSGEAPWLGTLALRVGDAAEAGVAWFVVGVPEAEDAGLRVVLEGQWLTPGRGWEALTARTVSLPGASLRLAVYGAPPRVPGGGLAPWAVLAAGLAVVLGLARWQRAVQTRTGRLQGRLRLLEGTAARMRRNAVARGAAERAGGVATWWCDAEGRGVWSPTAGVILGLGPGARIRHRTQLLAHVASSDREAVRRAVGEAAATGRSYVVEYRVRRPDGTLRRVREQAAWRADAGGFVGILLDVTELRAREVALARANRALRLQIGIREIATGVRLDAAEAACRLLTGEGGYALAWIASVGGDGVRLVLRAQAGGEGALPVELVEEAGVTAPWYAALRGDEVSIDDLARYGSGDAWRDAALACGLRGAVFLPIGRERPVGVLAVFHSQPGVPDTEERMLLRELAAELVGLLPHEARAALAAGRPSR